jgi:hypothetical protein
LATKNAKAAELHHGLGWPLEHATAAAVLCVLFRSALGHALRDGRLSAAARMWAVRDALLSAAARQAGAPVAVCFAPLEQLARHSLCDHDDAWLALSHAARTGTTAAPFRTHATAVAYTPGAEPWRARSADAPAVSSAVSSSVSSATWVRFEGAARDRGGFRMPIDFGSGQCVLPPLTLVTMRRTRSHEMLGTVIDVAVRYA